MSTQAAPEPAMTPPAAPSKPWWRALLNPAWVIAAILIFTFSYFALTFLAPWQLGKNERLEERNENIVEAFDHDPEPIAGVLGPDGSLDAHREWSRVTATGRYTDHTVLLRLRPVDRTPAFQVLTPFELEDGRALLVNRGWVPAKDSTTVPEISPAPTGTVTLTGMLLQGEAESPSAPMEDQGYQMVYSINPTQVGQLTGTEPIQPYLQLLSGEPGVLESIPLPQLETGNHLSYGLQWILFGILGPAALFYFLFAESRERRRFKEEQEQLLIDAPLTPSTPTPGTTPDSAGTPAPAAGSSSVSSTSPAAPSRARYANARRNPWQSAYDKEQERT